ncbi:MAG: xanthine dehydrogenase family protein molybdopterin-binding subunit, partial [Chloroflexi bacterium]|nr:xanthine dehydrogenase family protein molybdopterin-binding subunit [Chloroflexota bacterium]
MALNVIGQRVRRVDAPAKVAGTARFVADHLPPGLLQGKVLRSDRAHARLLRIDAERAKRLPGVRAVLTAAEVPATLTGPSVKDRPLLAGDRVRFVGEPIAAVAAVDALTAEEALGLIEVEYEDLPEVFDAHEALDAAAPLLHPDLRSYAPASSAQQREGNLLSRALTSRGDAAAAMAQAALVVEATYSTQPVHHGYIETRETVAQVEPSGKVTVWASCQGAFRMRSQIAEALGLPASQIRVIGAPPGGAFGGKMFLNLEALCVLLAQAARRPVRLSMTREDEFLGGEMRHPGTITLRAGVARDGSILALEGQAVFDTGAYASWGPVVANLSSNLMGPYRIPNVRIEALVAYTNNIVSGMHRAPGAPQVNFALESLLDTVARRLGMDPIELRLRNGVEPGDPASTGVRIVSGALKESLRRAQADVSARPLPAGAHRGRGIACGQWAVWGGARGTPASSCTLRMNEDGSVILATGAMDLGTGANTILAQIVAEGLGLEPAHVTVVAADTELTPFDEGSGGSMATFRAGNSVRVATEDIRRRVLRLAADKLEAAAQDLELGGGRVYVRGSPDRGLAMAQVAGLAQSALSGPLLADSSQLREELLPRSDPSACEQATFSTHVADVAVDPETGQVRLLGYLAVQDVGFALNPASVEGQIEG